MPEYVPRKGDFVVLTFDPQSGHEQKGRRPALVISNTLFNRHTGLAMVCPITNSFRDIPFHVEVPKRSKLAGYIMVEQIKSIDFASRKVKFVSRAPKTVLHEVLGILDACIYDAT
jgi:mRNA interferase MazF